MNLSRATAYYQCVELVVSTEEIAIKNAIDRIHYKEPSYGVRRIKKELRLQGFTGVGKRLVRRYMDEMCICVFYPGPNLSKRDKQSKIYPYLLRNLTINRPNQVWSIDISYLGTPEGFVYLVAIIDWHSRFLVGWSISNTMQSDFVVRTVKTAVGAYGKPEIINSDQGGHFTNPDYINLLEEANVKISMDGKGQALDNVRTERFFRTLKYDLIYIHEFDTPRILRTAIGKYINEYNSYRPHSSVNDMTPDEAYYGKHLAVA